MTPMSRDVPRPPVPWPCPDCSFSNPDVEVLYQHLMAVHANRRVATVTPNPNRRSGDAQSPWVQNALRAAANGEGLHRRRIA